MNDSASFTLYFIPSPFGLNWDNPTSLARDIVKNYIVQGRFGYTKRFMGHVNIELKYKDGDRDVHILTGMTAAKLDALPMLLKDKVGLGIVFHSFPGRLETKDELEAELDNYSLKGNKSMNFCEYQIRTEMAQRIEEYITEYKDKDLGRYYGLYNSALHGEGAGCSGFGASFIDVMGIISQEHKENWANCVRVPHKLIGPPIKKNKVNFLNILTSKHEWAKKEDEHHEIFFWDPDLMYQHTQKKLENESSEFKIIKKKNVSGLQYDLTQNEVPKRKIFKKFNQSGEVESFEPQLEDLSNFSKYN